MPDIDFSKPVGKFKSTCFYDAILHEPLFQSVLFQFIAIAIYSLIYKIYFKYVLNMLFKDLERCVFYITFSLLHYLITVILARGKINNNNLCDVRNKVAVVTGGCKGIGLNISINLLKFGCTVIMISRDKSTAEAIIKLITDSFWTNTKLIHFVQIDLDNFQSIKNCVDVISKKFKQVDFIINNSGISVNNSKDDDKNSLLKHFNGNKVYSTNVMGHYILTEMLLPILKNNGRVINMSSFAHFYYKPESNVSSVDYIYGESKLANIHHATVLQRKFDYMNNGCMAFSCAPGISMTNLFYELNLVKNPQIANLINFIVKIFGKTQNEAAQIVLFLCMTPRDQLTGGSYYSNMKIGITSKFASDIKLQKQFYEETHALYQKLISAEADM